MLAYNGVELADGTPETRECNYQWPTSPPAIIRRARFEAMYLKCKSVQVRVCELIIYDGDSGDDY